MTELLQGWPWLSPCPGTPEPAGLAVHPRQFARSVSTVLRSGSRRSCRHLILPFIASAGGLGPARPRQAGQGARQLSLPGGTWLERPSAERGSRGGQSTGGATTGRQLCQTPGSSLTPRRWQPEAGSDPQISPLCVPGQRWGISAESPPAGRCHPSLPGLLYQ